MEMKPLSGRRRAYDRILRFLLYFCAALTCALLLFIIGYIFFKGLPHVTWQFLSTQPSFIKDTIGILPNILNTVYLVGVTWWACSFSASFWGFRLPCWPAR